ncbi:hypothetical protein Scep_028953 [Stephania cephalantha]|uniref:Transcriptional adapter n=1 Tax=Stephania cephalantha TaxID=152367 RepID=A0AAP0EAW3_9MAGN
MGRYRRAHHSADDDANQRSKRKKAGSSSENLESAIAAQGTTDGKKALYHCNYCNKDISGKIRIKCAKCPDFDLCVECFSVGAEVTPHKSNHPYKVMDNLSFPLVCSDWNADEEMLLLEGMEMYGLWNWAEVSEHVGTKSNAQCIEHYKNAYLNSPYFPLPDMTHVLGKSRKELLEMAKEEGDGEREFNRIRVADSEEFEIFLVLTFHIVIEEAAIGQSPSSLTAGPGDGSQNVTSAAAVKKSSCINKIKDSPSVPKVEDSQLDRSFGGKKPKYSGDEGPSMTELSGYNPKRQEFDPEYDNDAEQSLAEMEFKDTDTDSEREIKLQVLRIYLRRHELDERKRRKDFILERNLLYPDPLVKELSPEEREIYLRYRIFMRFHSKEEHTELLKAVIEEHRIQKRIKELQEARAAGCRTSLEAERFLEAKRKKETEERALKVKESNLAGPSGKALQKIIRPKGLTGLESSRENSSTLGRPSVLSALDDWDIKGFPGADLLSETEEKLCRETKLLPSHYLKMLEVMTKEIFNGNISKKPDAYRFFHVEPSKVDRVYDMLVRKGIIGQS